jgi:hypothetical protein
MTPCFRCAANEFDLAASEGFRKLFMSPGAIGNFRKLLPRRALRLSPFDALRLPQGGLGVSTP